MLLHRLPHRTLPRLLSRNPSSALHFADPPPIAVPLYALVSSPDSSSNAPSLVQFGAVSRILASRRLRLWCRVRAARLCAAVCRWIGSLPIAFLLARWLMRRSPSFRFLFGVSKVFWGGGRRLRCILEIDNRGLLFLWSSALIHDFLTRSLNSFCF